MIELQRILCAVDFSDFSRHALNHALGVARYYQSTVTVLHVVTPLPIAVAGSYYTAAVLPPVASQEDMDRASLEVARFIAEAGAPDVHVETAIVSAADAHREILLQAERLDSDLIVLGTHGGSGFERFFLGSTAEKVLRKAACPVMTVPPRTPDMPATATVPFTHIVCATDFSETSKATVDYALALARESRAAITLTHVIDTYPMYVDFAPPAAIDVPAWTEQAQTRLHALVPDDVRAACRVEEEVRTGAPYREIVALAAERNADLIVLGIRGTRALDRFFFGSTAHHVVREAKCAVMTLRAPFVPHHARLAEIERASEPLASTVARVPAAPVA
jgi:nucleotide-binding universal stress UspA family protein